MIHITEEQVREHLTMDKALDVVEESFRRLATGAAKNHPRRRIVLENRSTLHAMDAGDNTSGLFAAKLYATNPKIGARFIVALFDANAIDLLAMIDANALGQIRTGAASGVATKYLAREDASTCAVIGSGYQAETQLEAVAAVRKLEEVRVFSRKAESRESFAERMGARLGINVRAVQSSEEAVRDAAIVVTITNAREPVVLGDWLTPGCHINAAGSNHVKRAEIDAVAVKRCALITADSVEEAQIECGDLVQPANEGLLDWADVHEFADVVGGAVKGRQSPEDITLFESQGLAIEDLAAAELVYKAVSGPG